MSVLILVSAIVLSQVPKAQVPQQKPLPIDSMTAQQQKEWLLAYLMVDLRFNDKKVAEWEKKLNAMTPTQIAATAKAYIIKKEEKRLRDERNFAIKMAKMQIRAQTYWHRSYYKYRYYNYNYSYPRCTAGWGYPLQPIYVGRIYSR
jgi:hypothetical protein